MKGNTNEEIDQQWSILQKHIGKTESTILVYDIQMVKQESNNGI